MTKQILRHTKTSRTDRLLHYEAVEPTGRSSEYIDQLAAQLAAKLGYQPGSSLDDIVRLLGGSIEVHPWRASDSSRADGSIEVRGPGDFTVFLSPFTGELRDRFTIAHELGHYFLHSQVGKRRIRIDNEGDNPAEWEANWFAVGFLLPREDFARKAKEFGNDLYRLGFHYGVSSQMAARRLKSLEDGV